MGMVMGKAAGRATGSVVESGVIPKEGKQGKARMRANVQKLPSFGHQKF